MSVRITELEVDVRDRILKPISEVFSALVDPQKMVHYFISGASGPIKAGTKIEWEFADVGAKVSVDVVEVEENRRIVFEWAACGARTRTTIQLREDDLNTTVVTVNEGKFPLDHDGAKRAMGQTAGWTYTLACLKAYLQFGINLRRGLNKRLTDVK
jgi:uncharacterized protein YndB with AHSA1/START domain